MRKTTVTPKMADHIIGRISGVLKTDSRYEAACKAIETMKLAGFSANHIRKAERILAQIKAKYGE